MASYNSLSTISPAEGDKERAASTTPAGEEKALPRLPRGWSRLCHETSLFLRGIGLGIIITISQGFVRKDFSEPKKIAIHQSRGTALLRSLVHIAPMAVSLLEIIFNWKGRYVGRTFDQQSYYQFAAKVHEVAIQASLGSIMLSYIRCELALRDGLPFGVFLGGLQFLQISYLWSTELWCLLFSRRIRLGRRFGLLATITLCSLIAATAGPSSANLLIPRQNIWSSEPTYFAINGTIHEIWPDTVEAAKVPEECAYFNGSTINPLCPGADYVNMLAQITQTSSIEALAYETEETAYGFGLEALDYTWTKLITVERCYNSLHDQYCASSPHEVVLGGAFNDMISSTSSMVNSSSKPSFVDLIHTISKDYRQGYTVASCVADTINGTRDQALLRFARISETDDERKQKRAIFAIADLTKASLLAYSGNISEFRLKWVSLPPTIFNHGALGAVLLHPQQPGSQSVQNITTCTMGAGWGSSAVSTDWVQAGLFWSNIVGVPKAFPTRYLPGPTGNILESRPDFGNVSGFVSPQQRMIITQTWAQFLNPTVALPAGANSTAIHQYFSVFPSVLEEDGTARIMALILSAGLSGIGKELQVSGLPDESSPCANCPVFEVQHYFQGWAYTIDGTLTMLTVIVMIAYCILAFAHTLYLGISGVSSGAWNSLADVVALAMNSTPTAHLQNTCAGIYGVNNFKPMSKSSQCIMAMAKMSILSLCLGTTRKHMPMRQDWRRIRSMEGSTPRKNRPIRTAPIAPLY